MRTGIIAALPRELKGIVAGWRRLEGVRPGVVVYERGNLLAACAGVGVERAALAVEAVVGRVEDQAGTLDELISFGLAGACDPGLRAGEVRWCGSVVDARSGERFKATDEGALLVTSSTIARASEKRRLHASYGATMVDMEAAGVARLARARGLRFRALKAVSDSAEDELEGMERFVTERGQFREGAFALHLALHPARWRSAIALGRASGAGLRAATAELARAMRTEHGGSGA